MARPSCPVSFSMRAAAAAIHHLSIQSGDLRQVVPQRVRRAVSGHPQHRGRTGRVDPKPPLARETLAGVSPKLNLRDRRSIAAH